MRRELTLQENNTNYLNQQLKQYNPTTSARINFRERQGVCIEYWLWAGDFFDGAGEFFVVAQEVGIIATMVVVAFDDFAT